MFATKFIRRLKCIIVCLVAFILLTFATDFLKLISITRSTPKHFHGGQTASIFHAANEGQRSKTSEQDIVFKTIEKRLKGHKVVNPHSFDYVITPKMNCMNREITIVMGVTVSRDKFESRQAIRETWGSYARVESNKALLFFFIGSERSEIPSEIQKRIDEEARVHGDILQERYVDHYKNLSLKSVSLLKWVSLHCPRSQFVLKSDDDMYVNVPLLISALVKTSESVQSKDLFIIGRLHKQVEPIRFTKSKYYTSENAFNSSVFPLYVSGTSYAMTTKAARVLYETTLRVPLFWLEDVYVTGICGQIAGVPIINTYLFPYKRPEPSGCAFKWSISGHKFSPGDMKKVHMELKNSSLDCSKKTVKTSGAP